MTHPGAYGLLADGFGLCVQLSFTDDLRHEHLGVQKAASGDNVVVGEAHDATQTAQRVKQDEHKVSCPESRRGQGGCHAVHEADDADNNGASRDCAQQESIVTHNQMNIWDNSNDSTSKATLHVA